MRRGKFELADGGTLFLDEIGDMPAAMQAKLLRVLQEGELERVGGTETAQGRRAGDRRDQPGPRGGRWREGRFREDLYYRLNVVPMHLAAAARAARGPAAD